MRERDEREREREEETVRERREEREREREREKEKEREREGKIRTHIARQGCCCQRQVTQNQTTQNKKNKHFFRLNFFSHSHELPLPFLISLHGRLKYSCSVMKSTVVFTYFQRGMGDFNASI
jgi:hypothetical protein